jgi:hypothetical protein
MTRRRSILNRLIDALDGPQDIDDKPRLPLRWVLILWAIVALGVAALAALALLAAPANGAEIPVDPSASVLAGSETHRGQRDI